MSEYLEKYDVASEGAASVLGSPYSLALATATDVVTTMWNSLPFTPNIKTEDVLKGISNDALALFQENPDTVKTLSLVAGTVTGGMVGMKLLDAARRGVTALGYTENFVGGAFTGARQTKIAEEISDIMQKSGRATLEYKQASRNLLLTNISKEAIDNAAIELAILGTLNAHPYMEDYVQDPIKNFTIGALLGGGIGAGFAYATTRRAITEATGKIAFESLTDVAGAYKHVDESFTAAGKFQSHTMNIKTLDALIADESKPPITREIAQHIRTSEAAKREEALQSAGDWIKDADPDTKQAIIDLLGDERLIGVDKIRFYELDKAVRQTAKLVEIETPGQITSLATKIKQAAAKIGMKAQDVEIIDRNFLTPEGKAAQVFIRLSSGEMFAVEGARNAALAVDIRDAKKLVKSSKSGMGAVFSPVNDFAEENLLRSTSSARVDLRYLQELELAENTPLNNLAHVAIAPDDLARMNAFVSKFATIPDDVRAGIKIHVRSDLPTYQQAQNFIEKTVHKDYSAKAKAIVGDPNNSLYKIRLSEGAHNLISRWIGGSLGELRHAMETHLRGGTSPNEMFAAEIWKAGQRTRDEFRKIADADGYVYLYRGIRGNIKGHSAVESYTVDPRIANSFGQARIFRVHVDNIIGSVDNPRFPEKEILVGSPHQQIVNNIPTETGASREVHIPGAGGEHMVSADDLASLYAEETERQVKNMLANRDFSVEEISARLNIKKEGVTAIMTGTRLVDLAADTGYNWRRYDDAAKIESEYLHNKHKLYMLRGNPIKNPLAESFANLDARQLRLQHSETVAQMTSLHNSEIAKGTLAIFEPEHMQLSLNHLLDTIGEINNQLVGGHKFQSADNALRKLVNAPLLTWIGKQVIEQSDRMRKQLLTPFATALLPLKAGPELIAEFNAVQNKLAGLEGWRELVRHSDDSEFYTIVQKGSDGKTDVPVKNADGSDFLIKQKAVIDALEATRPVSRELLRLHNLNRALTGRAPINDLGFYTPPISLVGKDYAFVIDKTGKENVRLLVANTPAELDSAIQAYRRANGTILDKIDIVTKGDQKDFNLAKSYTDYEAHTTYANVAYQHKGSSALAIVPSDSRSIENIMQSYDNLILQGVRKYSEIYMNDVTGWLDKLSDYYRATVAGQPEKEVTKQTVQDSAMQVKNILLGRDQLEQSVGLKKANTFVDLMLNRAYSTLTAVTQTGNKRQTREYFDNMLTNLERVGVTPPWTSFDEYLSTTVAEAKNVAPVITSTGNGLLATLMLRMFELAQPAVNIMSLPILTWSALMEKLPGTVINAQGDAIKFPLQVMYQGIRHMFSAEGRRLQQEMWEPRGLIDQTVRQYTEVTGALKGAIQGGTHVDKALQAMTDFQNSKIIEMISKPADMAERFTRSFAMHTGFVAAKRAYPGIDDLGATIAAQSFTDRAIGNYHAAQRPTLFQGSAGAALGLFQTYFLTFAQHVYRGIEERNFKQLAALSATQMGLFGMSSWPGFNLLSEQVVSRFNDKNYDLTTGTFRAAGEDRWAAELILYGLPSSLGPAFYTRGDISPRVPGTMTDVAIFNGVKEGYNAAYQIVKKTGQGIAQGTPIQSLFEALSLQSLNRPIARWSELITGSSLTQQGNTVSPQNEVWTGVGVAARLLATRPLEEQIVRNARHLDTFYGQLDFERRQDAMRKIKTAVRDGNLDDKIISSVADDYLRHGGSGKGFTSALNQALSTTEDGTRVGLLRKLEPDSPLRHMINDLY